MSLALPSTRLGLGVLLGVSLALGLLAGHLADALTAVPAAWYLLALTATVAGGALWVSARRGALYEPLAMLAVVLAAFVARGAELLLHKENLLTFRFPTDPVRGLLDYSSQEITLFIVRRLADPVDLVFERTLAAVAIFTVLVVAGYFSPPARWLAGRLSVVGRVTDGRDLRAAVALFLAVGLLGQIAILIRVGGVGAALDHILDQSNFEAGFALFSITAFSFVALLMWACWHPPSSRIARILFAAALVEVAAFYGALGSRSLILLPLFLLFLVRQHLHRPWRLAHVAAGVLLFLAFSSAYLGVRQATAEQPLGQALLSAPTYLGDLRGFSNDNTAFDGLFQAVGWFGRSQDFRGGASAFDALHSYVPSFIDPGKPPGADIQFREALWGEFFQGGRPYTVIGEFYADFGFPGIVLGSLLLGIVAGGLRGLVRPDARDEAGRAYRVALFACAMFVLYQLVIGTYAIGIGFALQLFGPLMLGVHVFGRRS